MSKLRDVLDVFEGGAKWHQGGLYGPNGSLCLIAALVEGHSMQSREIVEDIILEQYPDRRGSMGIIPTFNDHPDTTFDDVERVLEKADVKLDEMN